MAVITAAMRTQVSQLYVALFGRAPDAEGLGYWVQQMAGGSSFQSVAQAMFNVEPARAYYPLFQSPDQLVTSFYVNVLGRQPDADGKAYWTGLLTAQKVANNPLAEGKIITDMINAVVGYSGSNTDALHSQALFNNRVAVGQYYAEVQQGGVDDADVVLNGITWSTVVGTDAQKAAVIEAALYAAYNDAPVFAAAALSVNVAENGAAVATIAATDPEADVITYSIVGGVDRNKFEIDSGTGQLRFIAAPDYEAPASAAGTNVYHVTVEASDGSLSSTQEVTVTVTNVDEVNAYTLTTAVDNKTGVHIYNSQPDYTPGGNDFVNTLQDEDSLEGTAASDDTLNVVIGSANDAAEDVIAPSLTSIEIVNVEITGGSDTVSGIDFEDTSGVRTLNVDRITANNQSVAFTTLQNTTNAVSLSNATRNGEVEFNWAEGTLAGTTDALSLTLNDVTQNAVWVTTGDGQDQPEDELYSFETVNVHVNGSTNIDEFYIAPNAEEDFLNGTNQTVAIDNNARLEINRLIAPGAETVSIAAGAEVIVTLNERDNDEGNDNRGLDANDAEDGDDKAVQLDELKTLNITGSGKVTINGLNGDAVAGVDVLGGTMTGTLAIRVDDVVAENGLSSLTSGSAADEIITTTDTGMSITTNAGADHIKILGGEGNDDLTSDISGEVRTGSGADIVLVEGDILALMDTGDVEDGSADGDHVDANNLIDADLLTGAGNDTIHLDGDITDITGVDNVVRTGSGHDLLAVTGNLSSGYDVNTASGNDTVTFDGDGEDEDIYGTISTESGDDYVRLGEFTDGGVDARGNVDLGVGNDYLYINDELYAVVTAGTAGETNVDGKDTVEIGNDIDGHGTVTSGGGDDTIVVGGSLRVSDEDEVQSNGVTTETNPGGVLNAKGFGKTTDFANEDVTVAALIESGDGNDSVTIDGVLHSGAQWNDNLIDSGGTGNRNVDDTITVVGATVRLGEGDDTLVIGDADDRSNVEHAAVMEEQSLVDAGGGNDSVTVHHNGPVVLAADNTAFNAAGSSSASSGPVVSASYTSREASSVTLASIATPSSAQDTLGAKITLGAGNDAVTFNDVPFDVYPSVPEDSDNTADETTIIDRGAEVDGGTGNDVLNVVTVDDIDVVASRNWHDVDTGDVDSLTDTIVVGGLNAHDYMDGQGGYIKGVETINLTIENTVSPDEVIFGADGNDDVGVEGASATDDGSATPGTVRLDVYQVDTQLDFINLKSNEQRLALEPTADPLIDNPGEAEEEDPDFLDGYLNGWIAGDNDATFEIDNLRSDVVVSLAAYEATGVTPWQYGDLDGDFNVDDETWGEGYYTRDDCEVDVTVEVNMDRFVANNTGFTLNLESNAALANQTGEENYDVEVISLDEYATDMGSVVTTEEDDSSDLDYVSTDGLVIGRFARDITINVNTGASHAIDLNDTFGNGSLHGGVDADTVPGIATSLTVNNTTAGQTIELNDVRADRIDVNGDANIWLYTAGSNLFNISTGNGDDLIDITSDDFDYDTVDGGAGYDTMLLAGGTSINSAEFGNLDEIENIAIEFSEGNDAESSIYVDSLSDVQQITIINENNGDEGIADDDAGEEGVHTVNVDVSHGLPGTAHGSLIIDADTAMILDPEFCNVPVVDNRHSDQLRLNVNTTVGDDSVARLTDLDIRVNVAEGTQVDLVDHAADVVGINVTVSALADTLVDADNGGDAEGELQLTVSGGVDRITLVENEEDGQGTEGNNVFVTVNDSWATNVGGLDLLIDGSDIRDTDESVFNVYNEFDGSAETDANLHIIGTQDRDDITGGAKGDSLDGQDGDDLIYGRQGADSISGGNGDDQIAADEDGSAIVDGAADIVDGGAGNDLIYGGVEADTLTGGSGDDVFAYTRRIDSNGVLARTDLITDFNSAADDDVLEDGHDYIDVRYLVYDPLLTAMLTGKTMAFGDVDPDLGQLGGNAVDYADATAAAHNGNGVIEVIYQQDQSVLWFDLNDDGSLDNNDLRIRVNLANGATTLTGEEILGLNDPFFFGPIHTSDPAFMGGTVLSDHIIVDDGNDVDSLADGLEPSDPPYAGSEGGLATFGGNDVIEVDGTFDIVIDAGDGDDSIFGGAGNETLLGGFGNDYIEAGAGDDSVIATPGDDTVYGQAGNDTIHTAEDDDLVYGGSGNDVIYSGTGHDYVEGGQGNDDIWANDGDDTIYGDGNDYDVIEAGKSAQDDYISAGNGEDWVDAGGGDDTVYGGLDNDTIDGNTGDDWISGGNGDDSIAAGDNDDTVYGGFGDDSIDAGEGDDSVTGNDGDDTIHGAGGADDLYGDDGADVIDGGDGFDLIGGGNGDDLIQGGTGNDDIYAHNGDDTVSGGADGDLIGGGDGNDDIAGNDGDDTLIGQGGDDLILGGNGNDDIHGDDHSHLDTNLSGFDGIAGDDSIDAGAGDDWVTGDAGDDLIFGGTGNDDLYGDTGSDTIAGNEGDDWIEGEDSADLIAGGEGNDSIWGGNYYGSDANDGDDTIDGNAGDDDIYGGNGDDIINGGVGNDWLAGNDGDDTITGGENTLDPVDADTIYGGFGNDVIDGVDGDDELYGDEGDDDIHGGDGNDIIEGNDGDDTIDGSEGNDSLMGGNDADTIYGGSGDDTISGDDYTANDGDDVIYGGDGFDDLEGGAGNDDIYGGNDDDTIYGDEGDDSILGGLGNDDIQGEEGADTVFGNEGNDLIQGGNVDGAVLDGNDWLDGGDGNDTIDGNGGDDTIYGGDGNDSISADEYSANDGDDVVYGGNGGDYIQAGAGNDDLSGGNDNDTMYGDEGDDSIWGDAGDDTIQGEEGSDSIYGGTGDDSIDGGSADDSILGDTGDWIEGGLGNDDIQGNDGDDTIYGDDAPAEILGAVVDGDDTIYGGFGNDDIYGGGGNDVIEGNDGDDYIEGGAGDDTIVGDDSLGFGADTLLGGAGNDDIYDGEDSDSIDGGDGDDSIYLLTDYDTDNILLDKDNTGSDYITGFDVDAPANEGDILELADADVTFGEHGGRVNLNDGNIGLVGESIANARVVTIDSATGYSTADAIDDLLAAQNGSFEGSVYVLSDDGTSTYVWYDADVNSNDGSVQLIATVNYGYALDIADDNLFLQ